MIEIQRQGVDVERGREKKAHGEVELNIRATQVRTDRNLALAKMKGTG